MALVLGRKVGESVDIGNDVRVTVVKAGNTVRLAIQAPPEVRVMRTEVEDGGNKEQAA